MSRLGVLVKGELSRLQKYGVFNVSLFVAVMWGAILFLIESDYLAIFLPLILLLDATMMSVMYIGAEMHFEKTESTISTMLVTPSTNAEIVASKALANTIHNLISSLLIIGVFWGAGKLEFIVDPGIKIIPLLIAVISITTAFTIWGLILSYYQKDFTDMLVSVFMIAIFLMLPAFLYEFGVIKGDIWADILLINPIQAAQEVLRGGFDTGEALTYKYWISISYMVFGAILSYIFLAVPKFQGYAIRQSGV